MVIRRANFCVIRLEAWTLVICGEIVS
jgi:hypothetical protein